MRNDTTVFVGLDVHKDSIVAAYVVRAGESQDLGNIGVCSVTWIGCAHGIIVPAGLMWCGVSAQTFQKEPAMNRTTVAVDLAKNVYQLAVADATWRTLEQHRLTRTQFERFFANRPVGQVIMEACSSTHYWARRISALGIQVRLLPPRYVRAYVKRNKTDAADAAALLEAARCSDIAPVRIKSVEQQSLQCLHRVRNVWMRTRTARINSLRGFCREFGTHIAQGPRIGLEQIARALADPVSELSVLLRPTLRSLIDEIRLIEVRISELEKQLGELARHSSSCETLLRSLASACSPPPR